MQRRPNAAEDVVRGDLLRAEAGDQQDVPAACDIAAGNPLAGGKPVDDQLDRQFVRPLAVVQHDQGRIVGRAQRVEKLGERFDAAGLAEGLRSQQAQALPAQHAGQFGHGGDGGVAVVAQATRDGGDRFRLGAGGWRSVD